ncbi:dihydroxyacetone kinase subunit L [Ureibacillus sp. GCM10028918]|uniref:dihydroxyacetone kinase subunit L n=1 Tax=Ureibacillus sp. GCM10028918 TaxID=3273429 RepID=UPI0036131269
MNINNVHKFIEIGMHIANENMEILCNLDSQNGDGDLGITFSKVMKSFQQTYQEFEGQDVGKFFYLAGMDITENAASTMGTLLASGFMQVGKNLKGKEQLNQDDFIVFYESMIEGIQKRGKAAIGDKTILDTLQPIADSFKETTDLNLKDAFEKAVKVAEKAVENTKQLEAKHGRAARYENKSLGLIDSGSVVAKLLTQIFYQLYRI